MQSNSTQDCDESAIFAELSDLCTSDGYIHALAFLSFRGNVVTYSEQVKPADFERLHSPDRLIGTELATLIGLMVKEPVSYTRPEPHTIQALIDRTDALLRELHEAMMKPWGEQFRAALASPSAASPLSHGPILREPMFYAPDSAYDFQYRELSVRKYGRDENWLKTKRGFAYREVADVLRGVRQVHHNKITSTIEEMRARHPDELTLLPAHYLTALEISAASGIDEQTVGAFLTAFSVHPDDRNELFKSLHDFNVVTAAPLLRADGDRFVLLDHYRLTQAVYESPFFWMLDDAAYRDQALTNRGRFTEEFCRERLEAVFGRANVHPNVRLMKRKDETVGEIDVLVTFGNRALILQAKSKRLTMEARKGNDGQIRDDFKKSVQDSYDQALICARGLQNPQLQVEDSGAQIVRIPPDLKEIFILCVVSDHYPTLSIQAREFLKYVSEGAIRAPFVLDVFALDAIAEMLQSPLRFLSYIGRRVTYADRVFATHEMMVLAYHLKKNLWVDDELQGIFLDDSISTDLDIAMAVRREGLPGPRTPDGVLTRFESTTLGRILKQIETDPRPGPLELGFLLLMLGEDAVLDLSKTVDHLELQAKSDHQVHDVAIALDKIASGLTIHCTEEPTAVAQPRLASLVALRKYERRAKMWSGICISPRDTSIRFGVLVDSPWSPDPRMDEAVSHLKQSPRPLPEVMRLVEGKRIGRNEPCPCGSGRKYKKCHGK